MGNAGSLLTNIAIVVCLLGLAGSFGLYWRRQAKGPEGSGFFTQRSRRLAFVERTSLDGGRKLLLVRRDDVEHLILIGGPIDLVVETGIPARRAADLSAQEDPYPVAEDSYPEPRASWLPGERHLSAAGPAASAAPRLSLSPMPEGLREEAFELNATHETKAG